MYCATELSWFVAFLSGGFPTEYTTRQIPIAGGIAVNFDI
jgi:hypothetical protein